MKKKNEIEEEILDDEVLEDEEILDDDDDVVDDDEVIEDEIIDDEEDEKPAKAKKAKAAKKGGKKGLGKGAKIGITVGSVVAFLVIAAVLTIWVILPMIGGSTGGGYTATIGAKDPGLTPVAAVDKNMSAGEMLEAAVTNYYAADYAANIMIVGGVNTKIGPIAVSQGVQSFKVKYGASDPTDDPLVNPNSTNTKYYAYSKSSGIATMYEEYYTEGEEVYYRKGKDTKNYKDVAITDAAGNPQKASFLVATSYENTIEYEDLKEFYASTDPEKPGTSTDFTKLWSYKVNNNTILNYSDKVKAEKDYYTFTIKLDLVKATADYLDVMKYQLASNMGMNVEKLEFKKLELECAVYKSGYFKYIIVHEAYAMNLSGVPVIGELNGMVIENNCINEYSFDKSEKLPYYVYGDKKAMKTETFNFDKLIKTF